MSNFKRHLQRQGNVTQLPVSAPVLYEISVKLLTTGVVSVTFPVNKIAICKEMMREAAKVIDSAESETKRVISPNGQAVIEK